MKFSLVAGGCTVLGVLVTVTHLVRSKENERARQLALLTRGTEQAIASAQDDITGYNFERAKEFLHQAQDQLRQGGFFVPELEGRLQAALASVYAAENEFKAKLARGYIVFEGALIASSQRDAILAERERAQAATETPQQSEQHLEQSSATDPSPTVEIMERPSEVSRSPSKAAASVDLSDWKPDPTLPKPQITAKVAIIKEPERHKVSMKVTATEANGLTVHEIQFVLKYRKFSKTTRQYYYPKSMFTLKMIPKLERGHTVWSTAIAEKYLLDKAWKGTDDNWEIEITSYNQYYKE